VAYLGENLKNVMEDRTNLKLMPADQTKTIAAITKKITLPFCADA
jgi:hypothetical protein